MQEFIIHIEQGKLTNPKVFRKNIDELKDGAYLVQIKIRKQRSLNQNAYYWGVVVDMVKDGLVNIGYDEIREADQVHELLKSMFLKKQMVNHNTGEVIEIPGSTAGLSTIDFNSFIDDVAKWCSEYLGFALPMPNEQTSIFK